MGDGGKKVEEVQRLFLHHSSILRGFVLGLLPDSNRAEDVFQEIFLIVTQKADDYRPDTNFLAWTRAIARLKVLEYYERERTVPRPLGPQAIEALVASAPEVEDFAAPLKAVLGGCVQEVAPRAREILKLRYDQGLLPPQIAARLSSTVDAVPVALARVRNFLRECVQRKVAARGT